MIFDGFNGIYVRWGCWRANLPIVENGKRGKEIIILHEEYVNIRKTNYNKTILTYLRSIITKILLSAIKRFIIDFYFLLVYLQIYNVQCLASLTPRNSSLSPLSRFVMVNVSSTDALMYSVSFASASHWIIPYRVSDASLLVYRLRHS